MNGPDGSHPGRFTPVPVGALYDTAPDHIEWLVEDYLATGSLTVFASLPKVGKSTSAYALVPSVVHGTPFLGRPVAKGKVLILAVEEHQRDVKLRLKRFGITADDPVYVHVNTLTPRPENYLAMQVFIREYQITLVILDTVGHHWSVLSENDNAQVLRALKPWLELARTTDAAVLLLHHEYKPAQGTAAPLHGQSIRGASAFAGVVDQILLLRREGDQRVLYATGRYESTPFKTVVVLEGITLAAGAPGKSPTAAERILTWMREHPGDHAAGDLQDALDLGKSTFYKALSKLTEDGSIESTSPGSGRWTLTETGRGA